MIRFILYLFETGICLSLLYLAYWLFLRRETYFNFNRLFLVGSIVLALSVPLLHLNFSIRQGSTLENPAFGILQFRNYYEEFIRMIDADFGSEPGNRHRAIRDAALSGGAEVDGILPGEGTYGILPDSRESFGGGNGSPAGRGVSAARIILLIYIIGVMYFFTRFIYLVIRLFLLARKNGISWQGGFRMVEMKEDIAPFSFFRFLFINNRSFDDSEFKNVLEHEKAHIRQGHSLDHLFAHGLAVFQWFNPVAWQIRNALKTTHEYIADRWVIENGFEPFDYQSLLLKQLIGYHSVELVNNFNLKPIKKRIAMMTKTRSGIPARLKAMLVIPFALILFLLFADFTLKGPGHSLMDMKAVLTHRRGATDLNGLWVKQSKDNFSDLLLFDGERFSFSEGTNLSKSFFWRMEKGALVLSDQKGTEGIHLKVEKADDLLTIWWNNARSSQYKKSAAGNTLDLFLSKQDMKISLPEISQYRLMEKQDLVYKISLGYAEDGSAVLAFNDERIGLEDLPGMIENERSKHSKLDAGNLTAMLFIDCKMPMGEVVGVKESLRKLDALKIADAGYPHGSDHSVSPLLYHTVALPRLLPPQDARYLEKDDVEKQGIRLFVIDLSERNTTPREVDENLEAFIRENDGGKYAFSLEYDKEIPYGQYIETVDMVFGVVYRFREQMAVEKYRVGYAELGEAIQKEIRHAYPMVLSEAWSGI